MNHSSIILLTFAAFSAASGQLLFKIGARGREHWLDFANLPILLGLLFYGLGTIIWIYALSFEKLVNVYAFTALTFVLVYLGGVFIINERMSAAAIGGVMLILAGLYFITQHNA
jgi:drug/metabolite transporter (DMT)-like permease